MQIITSLIAQEILDSRGTPTVSVECCLLGGARGVASVPSGASTGAHESVELRDGDLNRYRGKGVLKVVSAINGEIFSSVVGRECDQKLLDELLVSLDGSDDRSRLGANALLGVSMAFARASAEAQRVELYQYLGDLIKNDGAYRIPQPMFNVINGGKHSDSGIDVQEFMLVPIAFDSLSQKIQVVYEIIFVLKDMLSRQGCVTSLGDEGGFAPALVSSESAPRSLGECYSECWILDRPSQDCTGCCRFEFCV
jgi:enolase